MGDRWMEGALDVTSEAGNQDRPLFGDKAFLNDFRQSGCKAVRAFQPIVASEPQKALAR